jgi:hypothetical protein
MERCHACDRQFGLVRHSWWGYHFCTKKCLNDFLAKRTQQIERMKEWLGWRKKQGRSIKFSSTEGWLSSGSGTSPRGDGPAHFT